MSEAPFVLASVHKRSFDLVASYEGIPCEGPFEDWPQQVQEIVLEALERKGSQIGRTLTLERCGSGLDYEMSTDEKPVSFLHIVAVCFDGLQ